MGIDYPSKWVLDTHNNEATHTAMETAMTTTTRTFGVEIECHRPAGMTTEALAALVRERARVECYAEGYNHMTRAYWKIILDGSLGYATGCEVVSPVLSGEEGIAELRRVMNALEGAGCKVRVDCGFHLHVGASDYKLRELRNIAKCFVKFENFFDHIMPASRRADANRYVLSNRSRYGGYTDLAANAAMDAFARARSIPALISANQNSRYFKLNLVPLTKYGTIEFRQHSGTVNADKAENWVRLILSFVEQAAVARPRARRGEKNLTPAEEMGRFFKMFHVPENVRAFYIARRRELHRDGTAQ